MKNEKLKSKRSMIVKQVALLIGCLILCVEHVNAQENPSVRWRILIFDRETDNLFWLNDDASQEIVDTNIDSASAKFMMISSDYTLLANGGAGLVEIRNLTTGQMSFFTPDTICPNCFFTELGSNQLGAFSPDNQQWAIGFSEDTFDDEITGGIAIFDIETGELQQEWRLTHSYFANVSPNSIKAAYVGGWDEEGILFFTWCRNCDNPLLSFYDQWNPLTNEVSQTGSLFDALDRITTLESTGEIVYANTEERLPFLREYINLPNTLEYWSGEIGRSIQADRPVIFYEAKRDDLRNPVWVVNGEAVYFWAGMFYSGMQSTAMLLYRDGRRIELEIVENSELALHGTVDGWLGLSPRNNENQRILYAYHADGEVISREEVFVLEPLMVILEIESDLNPSNPIPFELVTLPELVDE